MTTRADFTPNEWQSVMEAPVLTSMYVVLASPSGPIGVVKEMTALAKSVVEAGAEWTANPLINDMIAEVKGRSQAGQNADAEQQEIMRLSAKSPQEAQTEVLTKLKASLATVSAKTSGEELDGFNRWLMDLATKTAQAAKEGGFLGFGGKAVSDEERKALADLATTLGVPAPQV